MSSSRLVLFALGMLVLLSLPALGSGYFLDDDMHRVRLEEGSGSLDEALNLYCFSSCDGGPQVPWWHDPDAKVDLFRPLSSALFALDHALFPRNALVPHLHSLLWLVALVLTVAALYRRLGNATAAGLAIILFAIDDAHWQPLGWLSNRHGVVATVPVLLGLLAHIRWREERWRPGLPLSLLGYAVGALGGEAAVQAAAYVLAYEAVGPGPLAARVRAALPATVLFAAYAVLYRAMGYGARGHELYVDPTAEPARFLLAVAQRLPTLTADLLAGLPSDLWAAMPSLHGAFVVVGLIAVSVVGALARAVWSDLEVREARAVKWLGLGAIGSLLPGAAALPGSRLLLMPSVGAAAIIATVLVALARRGRGLPRVGAAALAVIHLVLAPVALVATFVRMRGIARDVDRMAREAEIPAGPVDVIVLNVPDLITLLYPPLVRRLEVANVERSWRTVAMVPHELHMRRTGTNSFELEAVGGEFFASEWEKLFRASSRPLHPGQTVTLPELTARVVSSSIIAFDVARPLEDPSFCLLSYQDGAFRRIEPPPIGSTLVLPKSPGLLEL